MGFQGFEIGVGIGVGMDVPGWVAVGVVVGQSED